jgi:hypothetical protein
MAVLMLLSCFFILLGGLPRHDCLRRRGHRPRGSRDGALARYCASAEIVPVACSRMRADADALADPQRGRPQHAAQLAAVG